MGRHRGNFRRLAARRRFYSLSESLPPSSRCLCASRCHRRGLCASPRSGICTHLRSGPRPTQEGPFAGAIASSPVGRRTVVLWPLIWLQGVWCPFARFKEFGLGKCICKFGALRSSLLWRCLHLRNAPAGQGRHHQCTEGGSRHGGNQKAQAALETKYRPRQQAIEMLHASSKPSSSRRMRPTWRRSRSRIPGRFHPKTKATAAPRRRSTE